MKCDAFVGENTTCNNEHSDLSGLCYIHRHMPHVVRASAKYGEHMIEQVRAHKEKRMNEQNKQSKGIDLDTISADITALTIQLLKEHAKRAEVSYGIDDMSETERDAFICDLHSLIAGTLMEHDAIAQGHTKLSKERTAEIDHVRAVLDSHVAGK